jgi:uncharacterized protein (DUF58 family)
MGSPYVKTFDEERELTLLLIVDRSGSVEFGKPVTKAARAVEVGAVLALAAARHHDRVGALIFSDRIDHVVSPAKGRRHALRVVRDLLAFQAADRRTDIGAALRYALRLLHHRAVIAVVSDFRGADWEEPLRRLALRHEVVAITVDDPRELELPDAGWIELVDAETGGRLLVDTSRAVTRSRLKLAAESTRLNRARALKRARVDQVALRTDEPYAHALHRAFTLRARRLKR